MRPAGAPSCLSCGRENREAALFCDGCGARLDRGAPVDLPLVSNDEVRFLTVLFADIVDSTGMIARLTPAEAQARLGPAIGAMVEVIRAHCGTVRHVLGDGVLAFFGAPNADERHALHACRAALALQQRAAGLAVPVDIRIGISSGPALLSPRDMQRDDPLAFGVTIHRAARLQTLARPGMTICSAATRQLTRRHTEMRPLGMHDLRGLPPGEPVFELLRTREAGAKPRGLARRYATIVGRDAERERLLDLASEAEAGGAGAAVIVGEPGIGKSHLAWHVAHDLRGKGWRLLHAETASHDRATPYMLVQALARSWHRARIAPLPRATHRALGGFPGATALASLLGLPLGENADGWSALEPLQRRDAIRDGVRALLTHLASRAPLILLAEDLHWADERSLSVLRNIAGSIPRTLLLATIRPDASDRRPPGWHAIALEPLSESDSLLLLTSTRGRRGPERDERIQAGLVRRAGGNPLFLTEIARSGARTLAARPDTLPPTVETILAARLDHLAPAEKRFARTAAVLGHRFDRRLMQLLSPGLGERQFDAMLRRLRHLGILAPAPLAPHEEAFTHSLLHEVTYNSLPGPRRRELHATVAHALTEGAARTLDPAAETIVVHAARGEVWETLAVAAREAGRRAAGRSGFEEAAAFFEQASDAYARLPDTPARLAEWIDLRFELRNALFPTAGIGKVLRYSRQTARLASRLGDPTRLGWATAFLARDLILFGSPGPAIRVARRASKLAEPGSELDQVTQTYYALADYSRGNYSRAADHFGRLATTIEAVDPSCRLNFPGPAIIFLLGWEAWSLARIGDHAAAARALVVSERHVGTMQQPLAHLFHHLSAGFVLAHAARWQEARAHLDEGLALCRRWSFNAWFTNLASCLGYVLAQLGEFDQARAMLDQAIARTREMGVLVSHAQELTWLAECLALQETLPEALATAQEAITVAKRYGERGNEALAHHVASRIQRKCGDDDAERSLREAERLATLCGMHNWPLRAPPAAAVPPAIQVHAA